MQPSARDIEYVLTESVRRVFDIMLSLPATPGSARGEPVETICHDGVTALVGISGPEWQGAGRLSCSPDAAIRLAASLLGEPCANVNDEVLDAIAEIGNMIVGNAKTVFEDDLGTMSLSIPTVLYGRNCQARMPGLAEWTVVPFTADTRDGDELSFEVRICLVQSKIHSTLMFEPQLLTLSR